MDLRLINKQKSLSRSLRDSDSDPISLIKLVSEGIMIRAIRANISAILAVLEPLKGVPRKTTPAVDLSTSLKLWLLAESKAYSIIRPVLAIPVNFLKYLLENVASHRMRDENNRAPPTFLFFFGCSTL